MNYCFTPNGWEDYLFFEQNGKATSRKINGLLKDIARRGPAEGLGKPEPLSDNLRGYYSRRIDAKNRLVYSCEGENIVVLSCRFHYSDH